MTSDTEIRNRVIAVVTKEAMIDADKLAPDALLADLNIDSIDMVMMLQGLEEEFGIYIPVEKAWRNSKPWVTFSPLLKTRSKPKADA